MYDLEDHVSRRQLVARIQEDIDSFCREEFSEPPRNHLGASIIGHDCLAYCFNVFRWLKQEQNTGQQLRLFNRGHEEERRFVRWLNGAGFEVREEDPVTKKQFRIGGCKGHFGGSLDSLMKPPERYGLTYNLIWLGEFKTHNEKSFTKLAGPKLHWKDLKAGKMRTGGKGVILSKPQHYKQMCSYGRAYNLKFGIYCAVNKDTDELYFEIVPLDFRQADDLFRKADEVVNARSQPRKIAQTKAYDECSFCVFQDICHGDEIPEKNCRSCVHAIPVEGGEWYCELYSAERGNLPIEVIRTGCPSWRRIV